MRERATVVRKLSVQILTVSFVGAVLLQKRCGKWDDGNKGVHQDSGLRKVSHLQVGGAPISLGINKEEWTDRHGVMDGADCSGFLHYRLNLSRQKSGASDR